MILARRNFIGILLWSHAGNFFEITGEVGTIADAYHLGYGIVGIVLVLPDDGTSIVDAQFGAPLAEIGLIL